MEKQGPGQLRSNCEAFVTDCVADLCFRYMNSTIPLLSKSKITSLDYPFSVFVQLGFCGTCLEIHIAVFLMAWLK